jgi:hypothetical protein
MTTVAPSTSTEVARPLKVLVPLIKQEIAAGDAAAREASLEYYARAGALLLEARDQVGRGEWHAWLKRNFHLSETTARNYMKVAEEFERPSSRTLRSGATLSQIARPNAPVGKPTDSGWTAPVREILTQRVDVDRLAQERQNRDKEERLMRELSHRLIEIGYKVLVTKLHPDKGGSTEAMARLNRVRDLLKRAI